MYKRQKYPLNLFQDIDDQIIKQSDCMKGKPSNNQPNYYFLRCCLCLETDSVKKKIKISLDSFPRYLISKNTAIWVAERFFPDMCFLEKHKYVSFLGKKETWMDQNSMLEEILGFLPKTRVFLKILLLAFLPLRSL